LDTQIKKLFSYGIGYLAGMAVMTFLVAAIVFFVFCAVLGIISFITWSTSVVISHFSFVIRLSIGIGLAVSILSKEGRKFSKDFAEDVFKL
jgi:ABC-type polysaccharide/polyol phosphate export permease